MSRRFWIGAVLACRCWSGDGRPPARARTGRAIPRPLAHWIQLALATPVVLWAGWPFFKRCWASFLKMSLNMWTLIGLGVGAA